MENERKKTNAASPAPIDWAKVKKVLHEVLFWCFHLRKVLLSIPVIWGMIHFARINMAQLPETVGLTLMSNGQFAQTASRAAAVWGPIGVTVTCLILMFCSRRAIYPWLISLFTLVIPPVLLLINTFPA